MYHWHEMMTGIMYMYIHTVESNKMLTHRTACIAAEPHLHHTSTVHAPNQYRNH